MSKGLGQIISRGSSKAQQCWGSVGMQLEPCRGSTMDVLSLGHVQGTEWGTLLQGTLLQGTLLQGTLLPPRSTLGAGRGQLCAWTAPRPQDP